MTLGRAALLGALAVAGLPGRVRAQGSINNDLTLSAVTLTFPTITETDFDNGSVNALNSITATIDATKASGPQGAVLRTSILSVRATAANLGGTKPVSDLQWRRSDLATWNGLTTTDVTIESRPIRFSPALNDPWSRQILFRTLLNWATDSPGAYNATLVFTLTITTP